MSCSTHEVKNTPPPLTNYNAYECDQALKKAVQREGAEWAEAQIQALGEQAGNPEIQEQARLANVNIPVFRPYDAYGHRIDQIDYHPAYHDLMKLAVESGVHTFAWTENRTGSHVARAALSYLWNQIENGIGCPTGIAYGAIPNLRLQTETSYMAEAILTNQYDSRALPISQKTGAMVGMTLTEKHAGSDLRGITTEATPDGSHGGPGQWYRITGHKWFYSVPMSDICLTLANTPNGPGLFALPRIMDNGERNNIIVQNLKDKCGNRSNASSHLEFQNALGILIGEEGKGIKMAISEAHFTRLDLAIGSAGLMRHASNLAINYCQHREVFGQTLIQTPLMNNVLADVELEIEANLLMLMRIARAVDSSESNSPDEKETLISRFGPPLAKLWVCKRTPVIVSETLECMGGNGYIEDSPMARLYREAVLNNIWEGTSNMMGLDFFRAIKKHPEITDVLLEELKPAFGASLTLDAAIEALPDKLLKHSNDEHLARNLSEETVRLWQASLMLQHAEQEASDAFIQTRIESSGSVLFAGNNFKFSHKILRSKNFV